ncbi:MAG: DNA gyrase subunit A [Bacilli bacterium]|nr:DNA gyrase subunit A [Bacilli bacterium]
MDRLETKNIVDEMNKSFLEYSMSVIISRAIPDLRDGLKPVHRRILYTMLTEGFTPDKAYVKCAKTVGAVIGNFHPHGDTAVYDAMVRMAQDFSYRHPLIDGHGNFGAIDGSTAAAYRYTESRISKIAMELLRDINKNTIDFEDNFDATRKEPVVLPSRFPNIIVNGTMGIAVGMATNIPPHNLGEVIDGCIAYIDNKEIDTLGLMEYIKGPDFPTGGSILGNSGIKKAYETGRGTISIRGKVDIVEKRDRYDLIITEVPYQVNTSSLITRIAELVRDKIIDGISDLREETSFQDGMKIVIELKRDANPNVVLNNLYKHTQLQSSYGINMLMLYQGKPQIMGLKDIISNYIDFQKEVIIRRTKFELEKAEKRAHILEGLKIALNHIDEVIKIIKESETDSIAKEELTKKFGLDDEQTEAILEMKLRRLTGLEMEKILDELAELLEEIKRLKDILSSEEKILGVIKEELIEIKEKYANQRKTTIDMSAIEYIEDESLIPEEDIIITLTNKNYIKRIKSDTYKTQNRGGVGIKGMTTNEEDFVEQIVSLSTHDYILFFTNKGKVYRLKGYEIPEYSRTAKGLPVVNLLQIEKDEKINTMLRIERENDCKYLIFSTKNGLIKRTLITEFDRIRNSGKIAITLKEDDELISVKKTSGNSKILMCSSNGRMVKFDENEIRIMGRTAAGVRGINLNNDICVGAEISDPEKLLLVVTEKGYGKKTNINEYRETKRGSKGVKTLNITEKNGKIIGFKSITNDKDLIIITNNGIIIRIPIDSVSEMGRVTQGVKLINIKNDNTVASISIIEKENNSEEIDNETGL